jgi:hypothetical protein
MKGKVTTAPRLLNSLAMIAFVDDYFSISNTLYIFCTMAEEEPL